MTQPVYCPVCREPNKQQADFCFKCNWVLTTKGMQEVRAADMQALEEAAKQKKQLQEMTDEFKKMKAEQDREAKLVVMLVDDFRKKRKEGRKPLLDNVEDFYAKVNDPNYHVDTSVIYNEDFYNDLDGGNSSSKKG
jgi:phage portal protein BeeE